MGEVETIATGITLGWDQILSYVITIVAVVLFILERRKNDKKPIYMNLQGQLKAAYTKYNAHKSIYGLTSVRTKEEPVTIKEFLQYSQLVQLDYDAQIETILGLMKSLDMKDNHVFNKDDFTNDSEYQEMLNQRFNPVMSPKNST